MHMKTILATIFLLVFLTPVTLIAQQTTSQDSLLDRLTGNWILQGTIAGNEITHDINTQWVLDHQYVQLKEVARKQVNTLTDE